MKPWIIVGLCCIGAGMICSAAGIAAGALNQERYLKKLDLVDKNDTITEQFHSVLIDADYAEVTVQPGDTASVTAKYIDDETYSVTVENDVLQVQQKQKGFRDQWYRFVNIGSITVPTAKITVTLPEEKYQAIGVSANLGDCKITGLSVSTLSVDADCGMCTIQSVDAASCTVICNMGDMEISDSTVSGTATLDADCGKITLEQTEIGGACKVTNAMGDVRMTSVTCDSNEIELDCGKVTMEQTEMNGICKVTNAMGDVSLTSVTCGSSEMKLDCGALTLIDFQETNKTAKSSFTLDMGDMDVEDCVLYNADMTLNCGDLEVDHTPLYGDTKIDMDMGDLDLNLRGKKTDYSIEYSFAAGSGGSASNCIVVEMDEYTVDVDVSFTGDKT